MSGRLRVVGVAAAVMAGAIALAGGRAPATNATRHPAPADPGCAGVLLRADSGTPVAGADAVRGDHVRAVVHDGHGGWYIGGKFWRVGRLARMNLAHLDRKGHVDPTWNPRVDGEVAAMALSNGTLYLAGAFRTVAGAARPGVAAVDAASGQITSWKPRKPVGADVDTLVAEEGRVYLGWAKGIIAVDTQSGDPVTPTLPGGSPFAVHGGRAYVAGGPWGSLRSVDATSGEPARWNATAGGYMSQVVADRARVLAAGRFRTSGRRGVKVAAWETSSGRLLWLAKVNGFFVNGVAVAGDRVYLGGLFVAVDGKLRPRLAALDVADGRATSWNPRWNAGLRWTPLTIAATGRRVFVGAAVTSYGNMPSCARRP